MPSEGGPTQLEDVVAAQPFTQPTQTLLREWLVPRWEPGSVSPAGATELNEILAKPDEPLLTVIDKTLPDHLASLVELSSEAHATRAATIEAIVSWVAADPNRVESTEKAIAQLLADNKEQPTLSLLVLLGRLNELRPHLFVADELATQLELHGRVTSELAAQISFLNTHSDPAARRQLHRLLDFMTEYMRTVQDHTEREIEEQGEYDGGFFEEFRQLAEYQAGQTENYLLAKHWQELVDLVDVDDSPKPGALAGVGGGATDETIYTFGRLVESDRARLSLGITSGSPITDLVLPIAPDLLARYHQGRIVGIYTQPLQAVPPDAQIKQLESPWLKTNHPDDADIYADLATPLPPHLNHPSNKLRKLENLWDFKQRLQAAGRDFYFDLARLPLADLHPLVIGEIIYQNNQVRHRRAQRPEAPAYPLAALTRKLDPLGQESEDHLDDYRFFTSLSLRKKVEDDFGLDLAVLTPWVQRHFLSYLERQSAARVTQLQEFVRRFGRDGLTAFVTLEVNPSAADALLELEDRQGPSAARQILAALRHQVELVADIESFLASHFPGEPIMKNLLNNPRFPPVPVVDGELAREISRTLLARTEQLLLHLPPQLPPAELDQTLAAVAADQLALVTAFRVLKRDFPNLELKDIKDIALSEARGLEAAADAAEMRQILAKNWQELPDVAPTVLANFNQALSNTESQFYLLKYKERLLGFMRFDKLATGDLEWGSFNIRPALRRSGLGEAFMQILNEKARTRRIHANAHPRQEIAQRYLGADFGFVADKMIRIPVSNFSSEVNARLPARQGHLLGGGIGIAPASPTIAFSLVRDDRINPNYQLFHARAEELAEDWHTNQWGPADTRIILKFDRETEYQAMTETMERLLATGRYVLTAYRSYPAKSSTMYLGFEERLAVGQNSGTNQL